MGSQRVGHDLACACANTHVCVCVCVCVCKIFFIFFSKMVCHSILNIIPCGTQQDLVIHSFAHFRINHLLIIQLQVLYSGYKSLIWYMTCKYFLSFCGFSFLFFLSFFSSTGLLLPTHLPPPSCTHAQSCNPMDFSPPDTSVHGIFPGKNTGVGCHFLLQGFLFLVVLSEAQVFYFDDVQPIVFITSVFGVIKNHCLIYDTEDLYLGYFLRVL